MKRTGLIGKVIDKETNQPFPAGLVNIYNTNNGAGTVPQEDGSFVVDGSPADIIQISFVGYKTVKIAGCKLPATIHLEPDDMLDEVVITVKKDNKEKKIASFLGWTALGLIIGYVMVSDDDKPKKQA